MTLLRDGTSLPYSLLRTSPSCTTGRIISTLREIFTQGTDMKQCLYYCFGECIEGSFLVLVGVYIGCPFGDTRNINPTSHADIVI